MGDEMPHNEGELGEVERLRAEVKRLRSRLSVLRFCHLVEGERFRFFGGGRVLTKGPGLAFREGDGPDEVLQPMDETIPVERVRDG